MPALLDLLQSGDNGVPERVDTGLARGRVLNWILAEPLADRGGWGLASGRRPEAPGVELVKLVKLQAGVGIVHGPTLVRAHMFPLEHRDSGWVLLGLDEPRPALKAGAAGSAP